VMRHHRLVGGDQSLAPGKRGARQRQRRAVRPADQLDHHIGVLAMGKRHGIVDPVEPGDVDAAVLGTIARGHRNDLDRPARAPGDQLAIDVEKFDHAGTDGAKACERYAQRGSGSHRCRA